MYVYHLYFFVLPHVLVFLCACACCGLWSSASASFEIGLPFGVHLVFAASCAPSPRNRCSAALETQQLSTSHYSPPPGPERLRTYGYLCPFLQGSGIARAAGNHQSLGRRLCEVPRAGRAGRENGGGKGATDQPPTDCISRVYMCVCLFVTQGCIGQLSDRRSCTP